MPKVSHNFKQTLLSLAYAADAPSILTGDIRQVSTTARQIVNRLLKRCKTLDGRWRLAWGPVVSTFPFSTYSDNTMMVVQSRVDPSTYAICIAGTNSKSVSDWLIEDFWIYPQVTWPYGSPPDGQEPKTSKGTANGLIDLQSMQPLSGMPGACELLIDFLSKIVHHADGPLTIHVTGHSLGGALAPVLALWLDNTQGADPPSQAPAWDPDKKATIKIHAFAGPSPGNSDFARWLDACFKGKKLVVVNNTLDLVPHAWNHRTMGETPKLYRPHYKPGMALSTGIMAISKLVAPLDYRSIGTGEQIQPLDGRVHHFDPPPRDSAMAFLKQVAYQHFDAYPKLLGLPDLLDTISECQAHFAPDR